MTEIEARADTKLSPYEQFRGSLEQLSGEIASVLPEHITVDRFKRVVLTAVQSDLDLLACDGRSLFEACLRCALVVFNAKEKVNGQDKWVKKAQYMPMVRGLVKMIRQSGEVKTVTAQMVYENDDWDYDLAGGERPSHRIPRTGQRGQPQFAYAMVVFKDEGFQVEIMDRATADKIRSVSKSQNGPWQIWQDQMWLKSVLRRLSKYLTLSPEQNRVIERDNVFYDQKRFDAASNNLLPPPPPPKALTLDSSFPDAEKAPAKAKKEAAPKPVAQKADVKPVDTAKPETKTDAKAEVEVATPVLDFVKYEMLIVDGVKDPLQLINDVTFADGKIAIDQATLAKVWVLAAPYLEPNIEGTLPQAIAAIALCGDLDKVEDLISHIENASYFKGMDVGSRNTAKATFSALRARLVAMEDRADVE
jgi:phage RecT family recombinase